MDAVWGNMPEINITLNRRTSGERGGSNLRVKSD